MLNIKLLNKIKEEEGLKYTIFKTIKACNDEDVETYLILIKTLRSELKDYSNEDIYNILCYFGRFDTLEELKGFLNL